MESPSEALKRLQEEVARRIVGQHDLIEGLLIGLLAGGHVLVEGVPGLAKTTAIRTLAQALGLGFGRVQFTPDLLPGDLTGSPVFQPGRSEFVVRRGPIFVPVLLADEINRAPAKVQSALLEAMEEGQVTIGDETHPLPRPFFVMATQNPVELEGTYPLPEAQIDRFLLKLCVAYPSEDEECEIVARGAGAAVQVQPVLDADAVVRLREAVAAVHTAPEVTRYAVQIVRATREQDTRPGAALGVDQRIPLDGQIALGASPRASIYLASAARARALLDGRSFVTPNDIKRVAPDVLRHRIVLSYEAEADGLAADDVVAAILARVETP